MCAFSNAHTILKKAAASLNGRSHDDGASVYTKNNPTCTGDRQNFGAHMRLK